MLRFLTDRKNKVESLPTSLPHPDNMRHWIGCGATRFNAYFVWFYEAEKSRYEYGPKELAASLPGLQVEAILEDGIIFRSGRDSCNNTEHPDEKKILKTIRKDAG